jgi:hypothetical protein
LALRTGLVRDQLHAEDLLGVVRRLVDVLGNFYAATFAASPGVNLGFNDDAASPVGEQSFGHIDCFVQRVGHFAPGNGNAVFRQDVFRLIFVDFHRGFSVVRPV